MEICVFYVGVEYEILYCFVVVGEWCEFCDVCVDEYGVELYVGGGECVG